MSSNYQNVCLMCRFNLCKSGNVGDKHHCSIRDVTIRHPLFTDCLNGHINSDVPEGPIFSLRFSSPDRRIPWHGPHEPRCALRGECLVCGASLRYGILLDNDEGAVMKFCCNRHYLEWWKQNHESEKLRWDYEWEEPGEVDSHEGKESERKGPRKIAGTTASEIFNDLTVLTDFGQFIPLGCGLYGFEIEIDTKGKELTMEEIFRPLMRELDDIDLRESAERHGIVFSGHFKPLYEIKGDSEILFRMYLSIENLSEHDLKKINDSEKPVYEFGGMLVQETTVRFVDMPNSDKGPRIAFPL